MSEPESFARYIPLGVQEKLVRMRPKPEHHVEGTAFTWRGLTAFYEPHERELIKELVAAHPEEALVVHQLKAEFGGRIEE